MASVLNKYFFPVPIFAIIDTLLLPDTLLVC